MQAKKRLHHLVPFAIAMRFLENKGGVFLGIRLSIGLEELHEQQPPGSIYINGLVTKG